MPHIIIPDAILKSPHLAGLQLPIQGNTIKVPLDDQTVVNLVSVCRHVLLDPIDASDAVAVMRFDIQLKSNTSTSDESASMSDAATILQNVGQLRVMVEQLAADVRGVKKDMKAVKDDVKSVKQDVAGLKTEMSSVKEQVKQLHDSAAWRRQTARDMAFNRERIGTEVEMAIVHWRGQLPVFNDPEAPDLRFAMGYHELTTAQTIFLINFYLESIAPMTKTNAAHARRITTLLAFIVGQVPW